MLAYGQMKIFGIQFILPPFIYDYQLKDLDGITLTWAFLGFSSWFSILLGIFELVPGLLLLFNRTKLLGSILLLPVLLAVFLVNNAHGFLPHMRVLTGILLLMNLALLLRDYRLFIRIFQELLTNQPTSKQSEFFVNLILIVLVTFLIIYNFKPFS
jgi:hypothetical protein